jgi:hypothetical protein
MQYPNIAVQFDDFDELFEVIEQKSSWLYRTQARFQARAEAFDWAKHKASQLGLGDVIDLTDEDSEARSLP